VERETAQQQRSVAVGCAYCLNDDLILARRAKVTFAPRNLGTGVTFFVRRGYNRGGTIRPVINKHTRPKTVTSRKSNTAKSRRNLGSSEDNTFFYLL